MCSHLPGLNNNRVCISGIYFKTKVKELPVGIIGSITSDTQAWTFSKLLITEDLFSVEVV